MWGFFVVLDTDDCCLQVFICVFPFSGLFFTPT